MFNCPEGAEGLSPFEAVKMPELQNLSWAFRGTGGTPMILFARPQRHARRQAQGVIGVSPVFPDTREFR
jgi:hypothetical protein